MGQGSRVLSTLCQQIVEISVKEGKEILSNSKNSRVFMNIYIKDKSTQDTGLKCADRKRGVET